MAASPIPISSATSPASGTLQKIGSIPAYQQISDFQSAELQIGSFPGNNLISVSVPRNLAKRKIYHWIWALPTSGTNYLLKGSLVFFNQGAKVGTMPLSVGVCPIANGAYQQTQVTVCNVLGASMADSIGIYPANPSGGQPSSLVLQPLYLEGEIDEVRTSISVQTNVSVYRLWIGVISSN